MSELRSICKAPSVSLYFDVNGDVLACCHNRLHPLGSVIGQSLSDIWTGAAAAELRGALAEGDLSLGCEACRFEIEAGNRSGATAALFDEFEPGTWPERMEFALSNRCNLACAMCNGEYSSRIRVEREGLPILPSRYPPDFVDQLTPFLPHLKQARFFGGEPFLIEEYREIWGRLAEVNPQVECWVTTNGTVRTGEVERVLERLRFSIGVSIDGATAETVEAIRVGARFDRVLENTVWFRDYCARRGTSFGLTYCLMTTNWHEFGAFLLLADRLGAGVAVNRVTQPVAMSLFTLPATELREVVHRLEIQDRSLRNQLGMNRNVWESQLNVLRHRLASGDGAGSVDDGLIELLDELVAVAAAADEERLVAHLQRWSSDGQILLIGTDSSDQVTSVVGAETMGMSSAELLGRPATSAVFGALASRFGRDLRVVDDRVRPGIVARLLEFEPSAEGRHAVVVSLGSRAVGAPEGQTHLFAVVGPKVVAGRPVSLRKSSGH